MATRVKLAIDAMGGDFGPAPLVQGALAAAESASTPLELIFVGQPALLEPLLGAWPGAARERASLHPASEVVGMHESPGDAVRGKRDSSIRRAAELVASGRADGIVSSGSTGAVTATMVLLLGLVPGVQRPAIAATLPTRTGSALLLDAGATLDARAEWLVQFAIMGSLYGESVLGIAAPRVGLLSIGQEPGKGDQRTREAERRLREAPLRFIGNMEGNDILAGRADVVVADGFTGNILLKFAESVPSFLREAARAEADASWLARVGLGLAGPALRRLWRRIDWQSYGGAPLLGVRGACIICHGRSQARAVSSAVRFACRYVAAGLGDGIARALKGGETCTEQA